MNGNSPKKTLNDDLPFNASEFRALLFVVLVEIVGIVALFLSILLRSLYGLSLLESEWDNLTFVFFGFVFDIPIIEILFILCIFIGLVKYALEPYKLMRNKHIDKILKDHENDMAYVDSIFFKVRKKMPRWIDIIGLSIVIVAVFTWAE